MKKQSDKKKKVSKGMPSAVLLSILIHAGLFLLAGLLVVFTVTREPEPEFEAPKAHERPKIKLKKPKVKMKKSSKPKSITRIVTLDKREAMPDMQLPEMSGLGDGLGGGIGGGFDMMMPDMEEISVWGSGQSIGNDLVGTFYDLKRDREGRNIPYSRDDYAEKVRQFLSRGFDQSVFQRYYRSPKSLYTTFLMIPPTSSAMGLLAYGEEKTAGCLYLVHYKGEIVYPEDITFRFWGGSGDVLFVGVDNEIVLNACHYKAGSPWDCEVRLCPWYQGFDAEHHKHRLGYKTSSVGEWIALKAGEPRKLDLLIGELHGGGFSAQLMVEVKGVKYERNIRGAPILPAFKTAELTHDQLILILQNIPRGDPSSIRDPI